MKLRTAIARSIHLQTSKNPGIIITNHFNINTENSCCYKELVPMLLQSEKDRTVIGNLCSSASTCNLMNFVS